ncbi:unnamed protein product [Allacma fusca]|uniref:RING-type E3 ubiquitin transferase n=1 Tax=Allacma fusca TaxID=39272 RepID=A0A8J2LTK2_9HEXA|nr:unnamed protein product [Allacma fusca]
MEEVVTVEYECVNLIADYSAKIQTTMDPQEEVIIIEAEEKEMPTTRARQNCNCSQSSSSQRGKPVPKKYTCPICLEFLLPPVYQCVNGHLICDICHVKVKTCPQCRDAFVGKKIRNLAVEEIVRECSYECKNLEAGCMLKRKYDQVRDHDLDCKFSSLNFCESLGINCNIKIGEPGIVEHLKTVHRIRGLATPPSNTELVVDIHQTIPKVELDRWNVFMGLPHFFIFDGKVFFLKTLVDAKEKCISWMICVAGSQKSVEKYEAKITYFTAGTIAPKNSMVWQGGICSFDKKFGDVPTLSIPLKSLVPQPYEPRPRRLVEYSVRTRITISVPTSPSVTPYVSAACLNSVITCSNPPTNMNSSSYARPSDYSNLFEGARIMFNSSSSSYSSSD